MDLVERQIVILGKIRGLARLLPHDFVTTDEIDLKKRNAVCY